MNPKNTKKKQEQSTPIQPTRRDPQSLEKGMQRHRTHLRFKRLMWLTMVVGAVVATLSYYAAWLQYPSPAPSEHITFPITSGGLPVFPHLFGLGLGLLFISWLVFAPLAAITE